MTIEAALRYVAVHAHDDPLVVIEYVVDRPHSELRETLEALVGPAAALTGWTAAERARALWNLVVAGVHDADVTHYPRSRTRHALLAAFRLHDDAVHEPWGTSLTQRFAQLKGVPAFRDTTSTQPMERAWKEGVRSLALFLQMRFAALTTPAAWEQYRATVSPSAEHDVIEAVDESIFREPSKGAQPLLVNLFVTTVFMRERAVYRRITERLVTARKDGHEFNTARGFAGKPPDLTYVPVKPLWGCTAQFIPPPRRGRPAVTRLLFPRPLRLGQKAHFASEIVDENVSEERNWIDVDIDHHGIMPGIALHGGQLPVRGLTIRVRFDMDHLPELVWWYAEVSENERYEPPPAGDSRFLQITGNDVQYTFTGRACQPRESYGLAFKWPDS